MSRKINHQKTKKRILVLSEGKSEITYSTLTASTYKVSERLVSIAREPFKNLENLLKELEKRKPQKGKILPYEEIHLLCDKENLSNKARQKSYKIFVAEIKKLQKDFKNTDLKIITSFPSFEFFLLLHFPITETEFKKLHSDKELLQLLSKQHKNYTKGNQKWLEDSIFNKDSAEKITRAITRAEKLNHSDNNSWSDVFQTVRQIINNSDKLN